MKKLAALAMAALIAVPGIAGAAAVKSDKLFGDHDRYAVIYTSGKERIYVDTETIEKDDTSAGQLPVLRGIAYAEIFTSPLDYPAYGNNNIVKYVYECEIAVGADQMGSDIRYRILNKLKHVYDANGNAVQKEGTGQSKESSDTAEEIYVNMYRLAKIYT